MKADRKKSVVYVENIFIFYVCVWCTRKVRKSSQTVCLSGGRPGRRTVYKCTEHHQSPPEGEGGTQGRTWRRSGSESIRLTWWPRSNCYQETSILSVVTNPPLSTDSAVLTTSGKQLELHQNNHDSHLNVIRQPEVSIAGSEITRIRGSPLKIHLHDMEGCVLLLLFESSDIIQWI